MLVRQVVRWFATAGPSAPVQAESQMIIDPHYFERRDLISRVQNYFANKSTLNDVERSCRDFKRTEMNERFLLQYNAFLESFRKEKFQQMEEYISQSLFKDFKRAMKAKEELPYYFEEARSCELVQARGYTESLLKVKSTNRWFQLTFRYRTADGEDAYHVLERSDKLKHFKFIKFYL